MPSATQELVFIGIKGSVLAIRRADGREVWRQALKGAGFVNILPNGDCIFAATKGELFCLDAQTGKVRWNNLLKGMGFGLITIAGAHGNNVLAISQQIIEDDNRAAMTSPVL